MGRRHLALSPPSAPTPGHAHQLVQLLGRGEQIEPAIAPERDELRRERCAGEQGADQDVGVNNQPQKSPALRGRRRVCLAHRRDGFIDHRLQLGRRQIGELAAGVRHRLVEHAPLDGVLDEFPENPSIPGYLGNVGLSCGQMLADLSTIIGSLDIVFGEIDR